MYVTEYVLSVERSSPLLICFVIIYLSDNEELEWDVLLDINKEDKLHPANPSSIHVSEINLCISYQI